MYSNIIDLLLSDERMTTSPVYTITIEENGTINVFCNDEMYDIPEGSTIVDLAYTKNDNCKIAVEVLIGHGVCHIICETSESITEEEVDSLTEEEKADKKAEKKSKLRSQNNKGYGTAKHMEALKEARPDYGFLSEEYGSLNAEHNSKMTWVIDPIDGTTNFLHAIPVFAISVALLENNKTVAGVIYNPVTNELYYAEKGQGAFVMTPTGNERLRVSNRTAMETAMMAVNVSVFGRCPDLLDSFLKNHSPVRVNGSTTLALSSLAAGQVDAFIEFRPHIWDVVTGYLIVKEAGGVVQTWSGKNTLSEIMDEGTFLATTPELKAKMVKILPEVKKNLQKK